AGEITYTHVSGYTYMIVVHTYTKASSQAADRDSLEIKWGDGIMDTLPRTNGGGQGVLLGNDIKSNEYTGTHTYPGLGTFVMSITDPNRIAGIKNINAGNSVNEPFYIEDSLRILDPAFYGYDNSPILLNPPIDFGNVHFPYIHNPNAYDPDGDSLSFEFIVPRKAENVQVAKYVDPNEVDFTPPGNTFTIDPYTGEVDWFDPYFIGIYNFAILIREYRSGVCIGTMVRDMEVIVDSVNNRPPDVAAVHDTCVVAGTTLVLNVSATDPDFNQTVTFTSNGGPYDVPADQASFTSTSGIQEASGTFTWNTTCDHVRSSFYQVIFKAEDSYFTPLVDLENWLITVVAPAPQNVVATENGNDISVTWSNPYNCATATRFIGFSVWRREGSNPFEPDTCGVGLVGKGYTKLSEHLADYSYLDQTTEIGKQYCYRILAEFADKALSQNVFIYYNNVYSLPSNEACAQLAKIIPVITNVSVTATSTTTGTMYVAWSKPDRNLFDSIQHPGPYKYVIWRSQGFPGGPMQRIDSISAPGFSLLADTVYNDQGLNTQDNPYSYKIGFYSNEHFIGETEIASSVYLTTIGSDHLVSLSWNEEVPWNNTSYVIYRKNNSGTFDSVGISNIQSFIDGNLPNLVEQCYRIKSGGSYSAPGFIDPIINYSEDQCAVPVDSVAPCPPVLEVHNICNTPDFALSGFINQLIWTFSDPNCAADVIRYLIYFSPASDAGLQVIDTISDGTSLTFTHVLDNSVQGCYVVTAIDSNNNESSFSNEVCVDNCPVYELPNVFTPNGDGHNDTYHPFLPIRFVDKVNMKIFDQWGDLIFATTDPLIGWDGRDQQSGKSSPAAVYYYVCDVFSAQQKIGSALSGYIHLFR
ncbi:MAG: gliding motility-associated C-terminal domain-containing protein, partial [Chitinophagales bacterium]